MSNLTETEVLYHRHLTLLKALEAAGVKVECKLKDEWEVTLPEPVVINSFYYTQPTLPTQQETERYSQTYWARGLDEKVTFHREPNADVPEWVREAEARMGINGAPPAQPLPTSLTLFYNRRGNHLSLDYADERYVQQGRQLIQATPELRRLLAALVSAIVPPSPAKVD